MVLSALSIYIGHKMQFYDIDKCELFRIKRTTLLEGETFLRYKHKIAFFKINCTFFYRKENNISIKQIKFKFISKSVDWLKIMA